MPQKVLLLGEGRAQRAAAKHRESVVFSHGYCPGAIEHKPSSLSLLNKIFAPVKRGKDVTRWERLEQHDVIYFERVKVKEFAEEHNCRYALSCLQCTSVPEKASADHHRTWNHETSRICLSH